MRPGHFTSLRPLCPACRRDRGQDRPLVLATVAAATADRIVEGTLTCPDDACRAEYPIIDGVPVLIAGLRRFIADNAVLLLARDDLGPEVEGAVGDALGPGSFFDAARQHRSSYAWDHYGDLDPDEPAGPEVAEDKRPGGVRRCLAAGLGHFPAPPSGPALDLGCAVGRVGFDLAGRIDGPVLGLDVHVALLRVAQRVLAEGRVRYPRRRIGLVYDRRDFQVRLKGAERVDFWLADALDAPFADHTFGFIAALNLLDCVASPRDLLGAVARLLRPGGGAVVATPFDWSAATTPVEAWIGGHSQRGPGAGAAEPLLDLLLDGGHPLAVPGLRVRGRESAFPWRVRLHDRSSVDYQTLVLALETTTAGQETGISCPEGVQYA